MSTDLSAAELLEQWLAEGFLVSQYEERTAARIRGEAHSFYGKLLASKGKEAAEAKLKEFNQKGRYSDFAAGIESVARGMLALAQVENCSEVVAVTDKTRYPVFNDMSEPNFMVVIRNWLAPGGRCSPAAGFETWDSSSILGLKALTLQAGYRCGKKSAQLGLVLPAHLSATRISPSGVALTPSGFVVAAFETNGSSTGHVQYPHPYEEDSYLFESLGIEETDPVVLSGTIDDYIGSPGAGLTQYIADVLPSLEGYLVDLAKCLSSEHKR